ncbi:MLO-like protein 1 [Trifolium pratense]|uniref:MLO-like protein 1 n=1 Tax=Trifolium pratense TaxID=57577 RepID=UPI001E691542|nr:MLO-like protein 1 [Trifolium pratense]
MGDRFENTLEFTPTWVMAVISAGFAFISYTAFNICLFFTTLFRSSGKKQHDRKISKQATKKIRDEAVSQAFIQIIMLCFRKFLTERCIPPAMFDYMLPCSLEDRPNLEAEAPAHPETTFCSRKFMVPLISVEALEQIHLFVFFLPVVNIILSATIFGLGQLRMRHLKTYDTDPSLGRYTAAMTNNLRNFKDARDGRRFRLRVFCRSILVFVTPSDYRILKYGFGELLDTAWENFEHQLRHAHEDFFMEIAGISLNLWVFAFFYLLLNVHGWPVNFWVALIPIIPLILTGAILKHIVTQLALEISEDHARIINADPLMRLPNAEIIPTIPDEYKTYWFNCPHFVLPLVHFIVFQTSIEMASFLWIGLTYGFKSCMMKQLYYLLLKLIIGVFNLGLCGYSTLPLYTIVTQNQRISRQPEFNQQPEAHGDPNPINLENRSRMRLGSNPEPELQVELNLINPQPEAHGDPIHINEQLALNVDPDQNIRQVGPGDQFNYGAFNFVREEYHEE